MRMSVLKKVLTLFTFLFLWVLPCDAVAASPSLQQAKKDAESKGYVFFATHDDIVARAKKEGKLRVMTGLERSNYQPLINGFKQQYPFMTDVHIEELQGSDARQRVLLEIKAGQAKGWDTPFIPIDFAKEYMPYLMKHDILGMAKHGVLKIHPGMIHPIERNMVSVTSIITVIPYNRKLISEDIVPANLEDFLKPAFKGKKFVLDLRPLGVAPLVAAWGLERTLDFARKLAAQEPVWGRGSTRVNAVIATGEYSFYLGSNFTAINRAMSKDRTGSLTYKISEPVPTINVWHASGVLNTADHPHAALLWFEFLASPVGQKIIDQHEPLGASVFTPGSATEKVTRGKKVSVIDWDHFTEFQGYTEKIVGAYGLPKADTK